MSNGTDTPLTAEKRKELEKLRDRFKEDQEALDEILGERKEVSMGKTKTLALGAKGMLKNGLRGIGMKFKKAAEEEAIEMEVEKTVDETVKKAREVARAQVAAARAKDKCD